MFATDVVGCQLWSDHWRMLIRPGWTIRGVFTWVTISWFVFSFTSHFVVCFLQSLFAPLAPFNLFIFCYQDDKLSFISFPLSVCVRSIKMPMTLQALWKTVLNITEDTESNKSCVSCSRALHISCWKRPQSKHSGQQDLPHCCSAVTQPLSTPFACCGKPFIFTITSDLGADDRHRASW